MRQTPWLSVLMRLVLPSLLWVAVLALGGEWLFDSGSSLVGSSDAGNSVQEATPDCETDAPFANPVAQRARHLSNLGVSFWHGAGYRGKGLKIAILDSGFRGYRAHLGRALPAHVTARSFRLDGNLEARDSQHGILCGEVVHALAPDAELLLANWESDRPDQFLEAVRWARRQGARILSCSLLMPCWSDGEGGGPIHAALAQVLGTGEQPGDVLCFASAGNTAQRHWCGAFQNSGNGYHQWQRSQTDNELTPWGKDQVSVELCWQSDASYELLVIDRASGTVVAHGRGSGKHSCAVARFRPRPYHPYAVRVRLVRGAGGPFHLVALGGSLACVTARGSIAFPADGPAVLAVGAVNQDGQRTAYSSCGPNSARPKPDLVAPVPFPSLWRARPFTGTSAAAPQAAALAALLWSRHPTWTAGQVRKAMYTSARDLGPPGHDFETGYGLIALPRP
jgi:hypothetical protein